MTEPFLYVLRLSILHTYTIFQNMILIPFEWDIALNPFLVVSIELLSVYYITRRKRRCAIIIFFILIRYILLIDRFLIEMVYTLYHLLLNWGKPRKNYLLNINNLSISQMFWYDIHFVFSNKIFKIYDIDEISPYSSKMMALIMK